MVSERKKPTAQVVPNKPALSPALVAANGTHIAEAALAADTPRRQHDDHNIHRARAPAAARLLDKAEVCAIAGVTFPTIWSWMRDGLFPRSRVIGRGHSSKSVWLSTEVEAWMAALPVRPLKGDLEEIT